MRGATGEKRGRCEQQAFKGATRGKYLRTGEDAGRYVQVCTDEDPRDGNLMRTVPNVHRWPGATSEFARGAVMLRNQVRMS